MVNPSLSLVFLLVGAGVWGSVFMSVMGIWGLFYACMACFNVSVLM